MYNTATPCTMATTGGNVGESCYGRWGMDPLTMLSYTACHGVVDGGIVAGGVPEDRSEPPPTFSDDARLMGNGGPGLRGPTGQGARPANAATTTMTTTTTTAAAAAAAAATTGNPHDVRATRFIHGGGDTPHDYSPRKLVEAEVVDELQIPSRLALGAWFGDDVLRGLRAMNIDPLSTRSFGVSDRIRWTDKKLDQLCEILNATPRTLSSKINRIREVARGSTVKIRQFPGVPLKVAFVVEFPRELIPDRFYYDGSSAAHVGVWNCTRNAATAEASDVLGRSSVISGTAMRQLQPTTRDSRRLFAEGRQNGEVDLFDCMIKSAVEYVTEDERICAADMDKKIAYLYTAEQRQQAPHRDFSNRSLNDSRRMPMHPWGLDMPLSAGGLLLNVWTNHEKAVRQQPEQPRPKKRRGGDDVCSDAAGGTCNEGGDDPRIPHTLRVPFGQVLLFSGTTVHGGGYRSRPRFPGPCHRGNGPGIQDNFDANTDGDHVGRYTDSDGDDDGDGEREGGCFRMHMYLSFAVAADRGTHAALEGQGEVELEDDAGERFSGYLLQSDGTCF
jgi:hypothetical protein